METKFKELVSKAENGESNQWPHVDEALLWASAEIDQLRQKLEAAEQIIREAREQKPVFSSPVPVMPIQDDEWQPFETMPLLESVQVYCEGADCVGIAHKTSDGQLVMPEPQAIGYDSLTHWCPLECKPQSEVKPS
jgi:hypothetical protein